MRRAQLLSLDAMLSLIIMMFVFAAVINTSAALKGEITSMLGWYERANIADNMLDVLTKSPGDPVDWENNPAEVRVLGLKQDGGFGLSYEKITAMNEHASELLDKFTNLSLGKDFLILTYISKFRVGISGSFPNPEITANYTYASELMERREPTYYFAVINGSLIRDMNLIEKSKNSSPWVEVAQRRVIVERFEYNLSGGPSAERPIVYGVLDGRLPQNTQLLISVPAGKGNLTIVILSGSNERGLMVYREDVDEPVKAVLVRDNTTTSYEGNSTTIGIPMKDLVEDETKAPLGIWLYSVSGWDREDVEISIVPSIRWSLKPKFEEGVLKLVVWDDG